MSYGVDHHKLADRREEPDTMADPEGAQRREERPSVTNRYTNDMMVYDPNTRRWVPSGAFIYQQAINARKAYEKFGPKLKEFPKKELDAVMGVLRIGQDAMESGPFSGFLYGLKDLLVKQICSTQIWMEHSEQLRVDQINQGQDPESENVQRSADATEKNRVALLFYIKLLHAIHKEFESISLTEFAWQNGAKQAAWDYLGYHKRQANAPRAHDHAKEPRRGIELLEG